MQNVKMLILTGSLLSLLLAVLACRLFHTSYIITQLFALVIVAAVAKGLQQWKKREAGKIVGSTHARTPHNRGAYAYGTTAMSLVFLAGIVGCFGLTTLIDKHVLWYTTVAVLLVVLAAWSFHILRRLSRSQYY